MLNLINYCIFLYEVMSFYCQNTHRQKDRKLSRIELYIKIILYFDIDLLQSLRTRTPDSIASLYIDYFTSSYFLSLICNWLHTNGNIKIERKVRVER